MVPALDEPHTFVQQWVLLKEAKRSTHTRRSASGADIDRMANLACRALHRVPVGQGPSGPDWPATALGFWSGRALATGTAWAACV